MFDIHCAHCGEPWDQDMLHELHGLDYMQGVEAFKSQGCMVFKPLRQKILGADSPCNAKPVVREWMLDAINAAHELSDYPDEWDYDLAFCIFKPETK
tara:strand:- start:702 stop:992 length:291 start_codon:yes stop_codon:yes gene_type:complete